LRGDNAFGTLFNPNAVGASPLNAYLLTYLSSMVYPHVLDFFQGSPMEASYQDSLSLNPGTFVNEFKKYTERLFWNPNAPPSPSNQPPQYEWVYGTELGYDPEAMVIGASNAVFVVFRGTDRVASARTQIGYNWMEWLQTDFSFLGVSTEIQSLPGLVHLGFWESLKVPARQLNGQLIGGSNGIFRDRLVQVIQNFGGGTKKVWITGHSLGAAHAQVFAAFLASKGIVAQGIAAVAAPHVGDQTFANRLNQLFPNDRLQRFDFVDDPVTMLPTYVMGYARAGTRVYYDDIQTVRFKHSERNPLEHAWLGPTILGVGTDALAGAIGNPGAKVKFKLAGSQFCFHYPSWYAHAAFQQVSEQTRSQLPVPFPLPDATTLVTVNENGRSTQKQVFSPCGTYEVARGMRHPGAAAGEAVVEAAGQVADAIETVTYNVGQLFANATGVSIQEGSYRIRAVKGGKYLDVSGGCFNQENGCKLQLWDIGQSTANNTFHIKKAGLGYLLQAGNDFVEVDANNLLSNGAKIQTWDANLPMGGHAANQIWYLFRIGQTNRYVIRNSASLKVLDAKNDCTSTNGCKVQQWNAVNNDESQVWILEKIN
jgi:pimeloyl-ACP methyl ester carboxylesterase